MLTTPCRFLLGWLLVQAPIAAESATTILSPLTPRAAVERACDDGRLLLLVFGSGRCQPCRRMKAGTWTDPSLAAWMEGRVLAVEVDARDDRALFEEHRAHVMPTLIALRDGVELDRAIGYQSSSDVREWLEAVAKGGTKLSLLRAHAGSRDDSPLKGEARMRLAHALAYHHDRPAEAAEELLFLWRARSRGRAGSGEASSRQHHEFSESLGGRGVLDAGWEELRLELAGRLEQENATVDEALVWVHLNSILGRDESSVAWIDSLRKGAGDEDVMRRFFWGFEWPLTRDGHWRSTGLLVSRRHVEEIKRLPPDAGDFASRVGTRLIAALLAAGRRDEGCELLTTLAATHPDRIERDLAQLLCEVPEVGFPANCFSR